MVELILDIYFETDLVNQVLLSNFVFRNYLDRVDGSGLPMSHLVNLTEATDADAAIEQRFEVVPVVFGLLPTLN